jgi:hypothetical protein
VPAAKHAAVKAAIERLGMHATTAQIIEELQRYGLGASTRLVADVRAQLQRQQAKAAREQAKRPPQSKTRHRPQQRKIP